MNKQEFSLYCAKVMMYEHYEHKGRVFMDGSCDSVCEYNPYEDLNQMAEVVERLMVSEGVHITLLDEEPIIDTFRAFIELTAGDKQ